MIECTPSFKYVKSTTVESGMQIKKCAILFSCIAADDPRTNDYYLSIISSFVKTGLSGYFPIWVLLEFVLFFRFA